MSDKRLNALEASWKADYVDRINTQKAYALCAAAIDGCPHQSWWATLAAAQDLAEREYTRRRQERAVLPFREPKYEWRHISSIKRWELWFERNGTPMSTPYYVDEIEIRGAEVHPLDVDYIVAHIMSGYGESPEKLEAAIREVLGGL